MSEAETRKEYRTVHGQRVLVTIVPPGPGRLDLVEATRRSKAARGVEMLGVKSKCDRKKGRVS